MAAYATYTDVQERMMRTMSLEEQALCTTILGDAAIIIDATGTKASDDVKKLVSCRMAVRILGAGDDYGVPIGATQGSQSALGYSQSWTNSNGGSGELYLSKAEKRMLRVGDKIGSRSPLEQIGNEGEPC